MSIKFVDLDQLTELNVNTRNLILNSDGTSTSVAYESFIEQITDLLYNTAFSQLLLDSSTLYSNANRGYFTSLITQLTNILSLLSSMQTEISSLYSEINSLYAAWKALLGYSYIPEVPYFYPRALDYTIEEVYEKIMNDDVEDIQVGDYILNASSWISTMSDSVYGTIAVLGVNTHKGINGIGSHIDFYVSDAGNMGWDPSSYTTMSNNNGTSTYPCPYLNTYTSSYYDSIITSSTSADYISNRYALLEQRYSSSGTLSNDNGSYWANLGYLWPLSEFEVFGTVTYSSKYAIGESVQYPLFRNSLLAFFNSQNYYTNYLTLNSSSAAHVGGWASWLRNAAEGSTNYISAVSIRLLPTRVLRTISTNSPTLAFRIGG